MFKKRKSEVLVVGAGPVGLFAALRLASSFGRDHVLEGCPASAPGGEPWFGERARRILACVPASGQDLRVLLGQVGLEMPP